MPDTRTTFWLQTFTLHVQPGEKNGIECQELVIMIQMLYKLMLGLLKFYMHALFWYASVFFVVVKLPSPAFISRYDLWLVVTHCISASSSLSRNKKLDVFLHSNTYTLNARQNDFIESNNEFAVILYGSAKLENLHLNY